MGQFITAKIELLPTKRKAALMERSRAACEDAFWSLMERAKPHVERIRAMGTKKARKEAIEALFPYSAASALSPNSALADGVVRDCKAAFTSCVELGDSAGYPELGAAVEHHQALDDLATSIELDDEKCAVAKLLSVNKVWHRPMTLSRSRECLLVEDGGRVYALLEVAPRDQNTKLHQASKLAYAPPADGERRKHEPLLLEARKDGKDPSKKASTLVIVPVAMGQYHRNLIMTGSANLVSCLIKREGDRWFMLAQCEMYTRHEYPTEAVLGIDRGIRNALVATVVRPDGSIITTTVLEGSEISNTIRGYESNARAYQKRTGNVPKGHRDAVDQRLHVAANRIVDMAKSYSARITVENLDGFKSTIVAKRSFGSRRNPWAKQLKKIQIAKIEDMLEYKAALAGLPPIMKVPAGGTSMTCPCCGHKEPGNRVSAEFLCLSCGFTADSDAVGSINIARRGCFTLAGIKKGDKMDTLNQNMVDHLKVVDDERGLGPHSAGMSGAGVVVAPGSEEQAYAA